MNLYDFYPWYPRGTRSVLTAGTNHFIALVDDTTVLKFPVTPQEADGLYAPEAQKFRRSVREIAVKGLEVEEQILERLGKHPRILQLKGRHEDGLLLQYLPNGSVEQYLRKNPYTPVKQRLEWGRQAAEGLAFIHTNNVIHCDVSVGNLLLDSQLSIKFCDFQGKLLHPDGSVAMDGGSSERSMSSMPRSDRSHHDYKTDIFALGTALFFIMTDNVPFPDLDTLDEDEIHRRFDAREFPPLEKLVGGDVVQNCWTGSYDDVACIVGDLQRLEEVVS